MSISSVITLLYLLVNLAIHLAKTWRKYNKTSPLICFKNSLFVLQRQKQNKTKNDTAPLGFELTALDPKPFVLFTADNCGLVSILSTYLRECTNCRRRSF